MTIQSRGVALAAGLVLLAGANSGCATKGFVRDRVREQTMRLDARVDSLGGQVAAVGNSAEEAAQRASLAATEAADARQVALGRFGFEEVGRHLVYFDFDSDALSDDSQSVLDQVAAEVRNRPEVIVDIYGFADPTGPDGYNLELGRRRAQSALLYLLDRSPGQLSRFAAVSYGERQAAGHENPAGNRSQQRRAVVSLIRRVSLPAGEGQPVVSQKNE